MTALLDHVRTAIRSLGNDGAVANVESDIATAARDRAAVDQLLERLAEVEAMRILPAA
jgi:hypothetical protein